MVDNLSDGVVVFNQDDQLLDCNDTARQIFDWQCPPFGQEAKTIFSGWPVLLESLSMSGGAPGDAWLGVENNKHSFEVVVSEINTPEGQLAGRILQVHENTNRKAAERELILSKQAVESANQKLLEVLNQVEQNAQKDNLTNVFNRRKFEDVIYYEISRARRYKQPLAMLLIDMDDLKQINDTYGHSAGDEVIVELAHILTGHIREIDSVYRWGGDEFVVIAPGTDLKRARSMAEKLRLLVQDYPFPYIRRSTVSIGVTQYKEGDLPEQLVQRVDEALYCAKHAGRNCVEIAPIAGTA